MASGAPLVHWLERHTRAAIGVTAAMAVVAAVTGGVGMATQLIVLAVLVAVLGLPHGAVDHWQGRALLAPRLGALWGPVFGIGYSVAALLVILAWTAWPPLLLIGFLVLAALHFGSEDVAARAAVHHRRRLSRLADIGLRGALPVLLPLTFHPAETASLFAALLPSTTATTVADAASWVTVTSPLYLAALAGLIGIAMARGDALVGDELAVLTTAFAALPPLLAFALYFCLWHAPRHSLLVIADAGDSSLAAGVSRFIRGAVPLTGLTIAAGAIAWLALRDTATSAEATLQVVFIGLAALTVPHVLLPLIGRRWGGRAREPVAG